MVYYVRPHIMIYFSHVLNQMLIVKIKEMPSMEKIVYLKTFGLDDEFLRILTESTQIFL